MDGQDSLDYNLYLPKKMWLDKVFLIKTDFWRNQPLTFLFFECVVNVYVCTCESLFACQSLDDSKLIRAIHNF